ncbi:acyltransferase [Spirosoma radiotolerans]|uniref:Acyl transferase n=1 Tax=Spirosoma radiotolerans TaxID=1379870 RepID=A0A0E3ZY73_9BACT|nr:acyltransferase [Spirosoma radiotolerans]AKD56850.1 acyl transferase [Spirosoma radiotolerans]
MSFLSTLSAETAARRQSLRQQILTLNAGQPVRESFDALSLAVFRYQAVHNPVYAAYVRYLNVSPENVTKVRQIPFMPIGFFKTHTVLTGIVTDSKLAPPDSMLTFASSGTTDRSIGPVVTSRHVVPDPALYDAISTRIFEQTYGPLSNFHILALLPSYLERNNSSLVYMVQRFMEQTNSNQSGFFLHNHTELTERLRQLSQQPDQKQILLIGVTFGLLDWAESEPDLSFLGQFPGLVIMETGGMKGRRKELLREEVHEILTKRLDVKAIHSEYGMTELLSQAYSAGEGIFKPSSTLRVLLRDINDPFFIYPDDSRQTGERRTGSRQTGGINVIDLANLDSCSFIETQDLGQYVDEEDGLVPGSFRVIGRFDNSDVRGCNLLVIN